MSSDRVLLVEEEDSKNGTTKKVKDQELEPEVASVEVVIKDNNLENMKISFREALLNIPGITGEDEVLQDCWDDDFFPKNKRYADKEAHDKISYDKESSISNYSGHR